MVSTTSFQILYTNILQGHQKNTIARCLLLILPLANHNIDQEDFLGDCKIVKESGGVPFALCKQHDRIS